MKKGEFEKLLYEKRGKELSEKVKRVSLLLNFRRQRERRDNVMKKYGYPRGGTSKFEKALAEYRKESIALYNNIPVVKERRRIRQMHRTKYKNLINSGLVIHHEWIPKTAEYRGVALVGADQHRHGIIDVFQVLEGEITLQRIL